MGTSFQPAHAGQANSDVTYSCSRPVIANSSKTGTQWLPFFSKLNLMQQGKQVRSLGFGLSISRIDIEP